jgi:hypothetical protein
MLPDFTRVAWASPAAQAVWAERVSRISRAWEIIERLSVVDGLRSSALQMVAPDALAEVSRWAAAQGLHVVVLSQTGAASAYAACVAPVVDGQPWGFRVAIAMPSAAMRWPDAWRDGDDEAIGRMLGFPACCRDFFRHTWGRGLIDTTWEMSDHGDGPRVCNILLRWLGVRAVTHLPCSFHCIPSETRGAEFIDCGRHYGFSQEMDWLEEMLDWPVELSALHGIAEIVTPVCRIQTRTNVSHTKQVIRREGKTYPVEGARGVRFPFQSQCRPAQPLPVVNSREWTDNGFSSRSAMDAAHARILAAIGPHSFGTVVDLGCGNGALLKRIQATRRVGVESDSARAALAERGLDEVICADCTAAGIRRLLEMERPDLVIAQAVRNPPETLAEFRVLSYRYDEPAFATLVQPREVAV